MRAVVEEGSDCWLHPPRVPTPLQMGLTLFCSRTVLASRAQLCSQRQHLAGQVPKTYLSTESKSPQREDWLVLGKTKSGRAGDVGAPLGGPGRVEHGLWEMEETEGRQRSQT